MKKLKEITKMAGNNSNYPERRRKQQKKTQNKNKAENQKQITK